MELPMNKGVDDEAYFQCIPVKKAIGNVENISKVIDPSLSMHSEICLSILFFRAELRRNSVTDRTNSNSTRNSTMLQLFSKEGEPISISERIFGRLNSSSVN